MPVATSGVGLVEWEFGRWGLEQDIDLRDPDDGGCVACSFAKGSAGQVRRPETPTHPLVTKHHLLRGGCVACDARERSRVLRGIEPRIGSEKCGFRNIGDEQSLTRRVRRFLLRQGFGGTSRDARKRSMVLRGIEPKIVRFNYRRRRFWNPMRKELCTGTTNYNISLKSYDISRSEASAASPHT